MVGYGWDMVGIWLGYGWDMVGIWLGYGWMLDVSPCVLDDRQPKTSNHPYLTFHPLKQRSQTYNIKK
jgi:hypothetical protein